MSRRVKIIAMTSLQNILSPSGCTVKIVLILRLSADGGDEQFGQ